VATFDTTWPNRCYSGTIIGCPPDAIRHSDVADITPVLADWLNDPFGTNQTPSWGWDSCRADVDVFDMGDNHLPVMPNAFWYHIPQVPFFSWFFGGPPLCAGGVFSSLGRYRGHARLCPPGGTNPAVLGDSDADGSADLVWRNIENGDLAIISPGFQSPGVPLEWQVEGVDDLDAQGSSDLVWRSTRTGDVAAWLVIDRVSRGVVSGNPSAWITQAALVATGVPLTWDIVGVRDLDGDSKADLIWRHTEAGHVAVWLMDGPHVRTTPVVAAGVSLAWQIADIADLDGDRKGDIVWREMVSGDVAVWLMDGGAVRSAPIIGAGVPLTWELIAAGDLDGDGKADLIWHNGVTGDVAAWLMNGLTVKASAIVASGALGSWQIVKVLDYDGDGKVDLLWRNSETGLYSAWLMDGFIIKRHESVFPFFGPSSRLE
jgi:hypothetical protein